LALRNVTTSGQVLLLAEDHVRAGHVQIDGLTIAEADVRGTLCTCPGTGARAVLVFAAISDLPTQRSMAAFVPAKHLSLQDPALSLTRDGDIRPYPDRYVRSYADTLN